MPAFERPSRIRKNVRSLSVAPHWCDHSTAFSWDAMRARLAGLPDGGLNIGFEALDRPLRDGRAEHVALQWLGAAGTGRRINYGELCRLANRFANAITRLGLVRGDRLFVLAPRVPDSTPRCSAHSRPVSSSRRCSQPSVPSRSRRA